MMMESMVFAFWVWLFTPTKRMPEEREDESVS